MAEEDHPESQPKEHKEEKKSTLESVIGELADFGKKALKIGAVAAMPLVFLPFVPDHVPRAAVTTYGVAAGRATTNLIQNKPTLDGIVREGAIGAAYSYPLAETFKGLNNLEARMTPNYGVIPTKAAKIGAWIFGAQPAITAFRTATTYGLGKKFRENLWPSIKATFKYLALPAAINVAYLYKFGIFTQMAVSAALSYTFGLIQSLRGGQGGDIKNLYRAINPIPYVSAGLSVTGKLARNSFKGIYDAAYGIGAGLRNLYDSAPKVAAPTSQAPAATPAPAAAHP